MNSKPRLVVVASDESFVQKFHTVTSSFTIEIKTVKDFAAFKEKYLHETVDILVLTSNVISHEQKKSAFSDQIRTFIQNSPFMQVILFVEPSDISWVSPMLRAGGYQYAKLPVTDKEIKVLIEASLNRYENLRSSIAVMAERQDRLEQLVGRSLPMQSIYQQIQRAARTDFAVLITGETGTGKDLVAQAIHRLSPRKQGPYVPVNLGAFPTELIGSELFGHEKGAFTGASQQYRGKFEQALDGTVFLDEIDSIDQKMQVSLLRLLETKTLQRLGGKEIVKTDARLIAASNADLLDLVESNDFRSDLYYRLDVFRIDLPPLRERMEDIPLLVSEFMHTNNNILPKPVTGISPECMDVLQSYDWPGNIRELKNVIQRAALMSEGEEILPQHLPPRFGNNDVRKPNVNFELGTPLERIEKEMIIRTLEFVGDNRTEAAKLLGISRRAIYNKLRKHGLD
ncbi:AAA domain-containing protein [candidate division KSB1 bacterium]|nr:AAA domain-containing protein [candidate division KSB1 bacterium]